MGSKPFDSNRGSVTRSNFIAGEKAMEFQVIPLTSPRNGRFESLKGGVGGSLVPWLSTGAISMGLVASQTVGTAAWSADIS